MKEKVIVFIVGLLLGAIISTGSIYFYTVANSSNNNQGSRIEMNGGTPPSMPNDKNGERPEMPNNNNSQNNSQTNNS